MFEFPKAKNNVGIGSFLIEKDERSRDTTDRSYIDSLKRTCICPTFKTVKKTRHTSVPTKIYRLFNYYFAVTLVFYLISMTH